MKKIAVISAAFCIALSSAALAETGGYPASPSHGVIGANPDGTLRYGSEAKGSADPSMDTVGRSDTSRSDDRSGPGETKGAQQRQSGK